MTYEKRSRRHDAAIRKWAAKYPVGVIRSWLEADLDVPGRNITAALRDLNAALGTDYKMNRLYEWLTGSRPAPDTVVRYAREMAIQHVLYRHGVYDVSDKKLSAIASELS